MDKNREVEIDETDELDEYEQKLQAQKVLLQKCQDEHSVTSCLSCQDVIGCETRKKYVIAVYESMSKGTGGGFEF